MKPSSLFLAALPVSAIAMAATAHGQDVPPQTAPAPKPTVPDKDAIVVQGRFDSSPTTNPFSAQGTRASSSANSDARAFVRCIRHAPAALLRPIVEGHVRDPKTHDALDTVIRTNQGCYRGYYTTPPQQPAPFYGDCNPVAHDGHMMCRSTYDRGALIEDAFSTYAPKFMLMRGDTLNKAVIARFRVREESRGKFRSPMDRKFYETVACMVQMEPERAVRLLRAEPGLEREARYRTQMIARTPYCTGNAKRVRVDPYQFRAYVADAVYHWSLAAKNVETLIPAS